MSLSLPNTRHFDFASPIALTHVINHNLDELSPLVIVIRNDNSEVLIPQSVTVTDANTVTILLTTPRDVRGKVTKGLMQT